MANKKIEVDVIIESEDSQKKLRELTKALKQLPSGTEDWKKVYREIDDLKDRLKGAKQGTDDWVDSIENAGGPLGMFGSAINKGKVAFSSFNTALKASIIGLIVAAVAGLAAAFSQNEAAMKKLQPLMIGLEKILGGIFRAFEPLLNAFIEMATSALPYITKGIGIFYSVLYGLFSFIKNVGTGVGKILKGIFTLDWDSVTEGYDAIKNSIGDSVDEAKAAFGRYEAGTQEVTKTEKEELDKRQKANDEAAKKAEEARKAALEALKRDLDAKIKLETDKEDTSKEALKKLLDERYKAEIADKKLSNAEKLALQAEYAKKLEDAIKADEDAARKKRIAELDAAIQMEIDKTDTNQKTLKSLLDKRLEEELANTELGEQQKLAIKAKYAKQLDDAIKADNEKKKSDTIKALQDELAAAQGNLDAQLAAYADFQLKTKDLVGLGEKEKADLIKSFQDQILKTITEGFQNQENITEEKYGEFKRFDADYYADKRNNLVQAQADLKAAYDAGTITEAEFNKNKAAFSKANKEIDKQEAASKVEMVALAGNALGQLSELVGKDTVAGKAFAIAKATIDTYQSAVAAYKSLAGIPIVGPILGGIAAAAAIATGIATVQKIVAVQVPQTPTSQKIDAGGATGGNTSSGPINVNAGGRADGGYVEGAGTGRSDSIPSMLSNGEFVVNANGTKTFGPILNAINAYGKQPQARFALGGQVNSQNAPSGDNASLIDILGDAMSKNPIKTYVVSQDMSTQQMFDRTIKSRSTI
jgi:hypothetical protein